MRATVVRKGARTVPALAALTLAVLPGCTTEGTPRAANLPSVSPSQPPAGGRIPSGRIGSPSNPLVLSCGQESFSDPPPPQQPQPGDLAIGPLYFGNGSRLSTANPAAYSDHGSWKIPLVLAMGSTATVEIAARAREHVVITNPYTPADGVVAATYHSCAHESGFFAQSFTFLHGQTRGCVPIDVSISNERQVRHATLSLSAGSCDT